MRPFSSSPAGVPPSGHPPPGPTDPDTALDIYPAEVACRRARLGRLVRHWERVNGPVSAQLPADDLKAQLADQSLPTVLYLAIRIA
jgi:hypothetical protein